MPAMLLMARSNSAIGQSTETRSSRRSDRNARRVRSTVTSSVAASSALGHARARPQSTCPGGRDEASAQLPFCADRSAERGEILPIILRQPHPLRLILDARDQRQRRARAARARQPFDDARIDIGAVTRSVSRCAQAGRQSAHP